MFGGVPPLLIGLLLGMLCLIALAMVLLGMDAQAKRVGARVRSVAEGGRVTAASGPSSLRRAGPGFGQTGFWARVGSVFGIEAGRAKPDLPPQAVLPITLVAAIASWPVLSWALGGLATAFVPVVWLLLSRAAFGMARAKRLDKLYRQFPDALGTIIRAVRVGLPVAEAIRTVARDSPQPTASEFSQLADALTVGVPLDEALRDMATRGGLAEYRFFATALILQAQTGGGLTETLDNLADVIRRRIGLRMRAIALASEARTSAMILGLLPIFTGLVLALINPSYIGQLFAPDGRIVLAIAIGMLAAGALVMRSLIQRSLQL